MGSHYKGATPTKAIEEKIINLFFERDRYLLIGEIALRFNYHLDYIENVVEYLEYKGVLRRLSLQEKKELDLHVLAEAFVLNTEKKYYISEEDS